MRTRSGPRALIAFAGVVAILATACGTASTSPSATTAASQAAASAAASASTPPPAVTAAPLPADQPGPNGGAVVRWFVGLGAGGQPQQFAAEQAFVNAFNDSPEAKDKVYISLEIYNNNVAASLLATQIAAGNAPDIIGPVGVEGLNIFRDQ